MESQAVLQSPNTAVYAGLLMGMAIVLAINKKPELAIGLGVIALLLFNVAQLFKLFGH